MQLDLAYLAEEDRLRFSIRGDVDWLLTRSMTLRLVNAWVQKLQQIELPDIGIPLGERDLAQEHLLSLEFDGPRAMSEAPPPAPFIKLLREVDLTVDALGTRLVLRAADATTDLRLTRKESHLLLEVLSRKAREAQWLTAAQWPAWLGSENVQK